MEWVPILISLGALGVSAYALRRAIHADTQRDSGRDAIGKAIEAGNLLLADLRVNDDTEDERRVRYDAWMETAHAAIQKADAPQLGAFHAEIVGVTKIRTVLVERLKRLHEILDKL